MTSRPKWIYSDEKIRKAPMSFIMFNREHNNTRGFYTATYNTMNEHTFFCSNDECGNVAAWEGGLCMSCPDPDAAGWMLCRRCEEYCELDDFPSLDVEICRNCEAASPGCEAAPAGCVDCGEEYSVGLGLDPTRCPRCVLSAHYPCMGSPIPEPPAVIRMPLYYAESISICDECDRSEGGYDEDCTDPPPAKSFEDSLEAIARIKEKMETFLTPSQQMHWERLLKFREDELAENEAEMWAGYDADDLRKMDIQNRSGF